jgi:hypothetical protein
MPGGVGAIVVLTTRGVGAMHVELSPEEYRLLAELLERDIRDLREEIHRTETYDYKRALLARKQTLIGLIEKLGATAVT